MSGAGPAVGVADENLPLCDVIVVQEYAPTGTTSMQEELYLQQGQIVSILSKDPADARHDTRFWVGRLKGGGRLGLVHKESVKPYTARPTASVNNAAKQELQRHARETGLTEIEDDTLVRKECVGAGGFGRVFRAEWDGQNVAVKELNVTSIEEEARNIKVRELLDEGGVIARCSHRNICQIYGVVIDPERFCLVLEFCQGGTLARGLQDVMLSPETIVDWATQIAKGMAYLHDDNHRSVVHRDLKSNNILLSLPPLQGGSGGDAGDGDEGANGDAGPNTVENVLKISDFGLARDFSQTTKMTQEGTIAWMAPEVIRTGRYSKASDVFSYGVVLWELLTSQVPYHKIHYLTVAYTVAMKGCTLPVPSDCPAMFRELMTSCWSGGETTERPAFSAIVATLARESPAFADTAPEAWTLTQAGWRSEMAPLFEKLVLSEEEVHKQRNELERMKARHEEQEKKETELAKREHELAEREQKMHHREVAQVMNEQIRSPLQGNFGDALGAGGAAAAADRGNKVSSPERALSGPSSFFSNGSNGSSHQHNAAVTGGSTSIRSRAATFTKKLILQRSSSNSDHSHSSSGGGAVTKKGLSIDSTPLGFKHVIHCSSVGISRSIAGLVDSPVLARSTDIAQPELQATFIESWKCVQCGAANRLDQIGCLRCSAARSLPNSPSSPRSGESSSPTTSLMSPRNRVGVGADASATTGFRVRSATTAALGGGGAGAKDGLPVTSPRASKSNSLKPRAFSSTDFSSSSPSSAQLHAFVLAGDRPTRRSTTGATTTASSASSSSSPFSSPFSKRMGLGKKKAVAKADPLWLKPSWSKKDAMKALVGKEDGTFVVRSSASRPGSFAISVVHKHSSALDQMHVWHGLILRSETTPVRYRLGTVKGGIFASLVELVTHFQKIPYTVDEGRPCILASKSPGKLKLKRNSKLQLTTVPPDHTPPRSGDKVVPGSVGGGGGGAATRATFSRSRSPPSHYPSNSANSSHGTDQRYSTLPNRRARTLSSPPEPTNTRLPRRQTSPAAGGGGVPTPSPSPPPPPSQSNSNPFEMDVSSNV